MGLSTPLIAPAVAQAQTATFRDVSLNHWASDYVEALTDLGILNGFPDGTFRPSAPVTRAQFAAILRQAFLKSEPASGESFADVPPNHWATQAISVARSAGFLSGYPGNVFRPEQNIPRVQALVSLTNGLEYSGKDTAVLSYYADAEAIPNYARPSLAAATQANLVVNYPNINQLNPNRNATRADVVAFIYQALVQEGKAEPLAKTPYVVTATASSWQREPIATIPVKAQQLGMSNSGQRLITRTAGGDMLQVWNTQTGEQVTEIVTDGETRFDAVAINADGTQVAAIVQTLPTNALELWLWDIQSEKRLWRTPLGSTQGQFRDGGFVSTPLTKIAFRPGDEAILTQISEGFGPADRPADIRLRLHDIATGEVLRSLETTPGAELRQFEFSSDGELLAGVGFVTPGSGGEAGQVIDVWRLSDGTRLRTLRPDENNYSFVDMVFTVNGLLKVLAQQIYDIRLDTWNVRTGERIDRITELPGIDRQDRIGRLSPDGEYYFVRSDVAGTRLINIQTQTVTYLGGYVEQEAVFNTTGDYLAIASLEDVQIFSQVEP